MYPKVSFLNIVNLLLDTNVLPKKMKNFAKKNSKLQE